MPRKYTKGNRRSRRRRRRRTNNKSLHMTGTAKTFPLPRKFKTSLRYSDRGFLLNPGIGGVAAEQVFSANGIYDPDITGSGHQALGFDQLMTMYDHYTVIGSKITAEFINQDTSYSNQVVMYLNDANTGVGVNFNSLIENGNSKSILLSPVGGSKDRGILTMKANPNKFLGRSHPMADSDLKGNVSANPTEQAYWILQVAPNSTVDASPVEAVITIEYQVVFTEPKTLAQS